MTRLPFPTAAASLADPVSRKRPGVRFSSTVCLMASRVSGTRCMAAGSCAGEGLRKRREGLRPIVNRNRSQSLLKERPIVD